MKPLFFSLAMISASLRRRSAPCPYFVKSFVIPMPSRHHQHQQPSRLFFSSSNNNNDESSLSNQIVGKAKKWLPFLKSKEEKRQDQIVQNQKDELQAGINSLFKDAPFPIRMVGGLVGSMVSSLAEQAASQQAETQQIMAQATRAIQSSYAVENMLGSNLQVGTPFSQSSSSSSINGISTTVVDIAFPVAGSKGRGVARLCVQTGAGNANQQRLVVEGNGQSVNVDMTGASSSPSSSGQFSFEKNDDTNNVIEAEIVDKTSKRP